MKPPLPIGTAAAAGTSPHRAQVTGEGNLDVQPPLGRAAAAEGEGLLDYWRILSSQKSRLFLAGAAGALLGVLFTLPQTPTYEARASIQIDPPRGNALGLAEAAPPAGGGRSPEFYISTQVKVLRSRTLLGRVVDRLSADGRGRLREPGRLQAWLAALGWIERPGPLSREQAISEAGAAYRIIPSIRSGIVEVAASGSNPALAAEFANVLAEEFIQHTIGTRLRGSETAGAWLSRQLDEIRAQLEDSEGRLQRYARASDLVYTAEKESVDEQKLRQLQTVLLRAQTERIDAQSRFEPAESASPGALPELLDDPTLRDYQLALTGLLRNLAELSTTYKPTHPKRKRLEAQIEQLEAVIAAAGSRILKRLGHDFNAARRREGLLADNYAAQTRRVGIQAEKSIQYNILSREVASNRLLYDSLLRKVKEARVASAINAGNVRILDRAIPPRRPTRPDPLLNASLGMLSGLLLGAVLLLVHDRADATVRHPEQALHWLSVPLLGVIPNAAAGRSISSGGGRAESARRRRPEPGILALRGSSASAGDGRIERITWGQPPSFTAECFRATLTSILFTKQEGVETPAFVVASPSPGEGKTTVAGNLAIALAEIQRRVLLIDGDLRRPRLHKLFDVPNQWGLTNLLSNGDEPLPPGRDGLGLKTDIPGLYLLPSGPPAHAAANLLHSERAAALFDRLRGEFDALVIDSPPMLQVSDARVLARRAGAAIVVLRADKTTQQDAQTAITRFQQDGTPVLGTVLNDWNPGAKRSKGLRHAWRPAPGTEA